MAETMTAAAVFMTDKEVLSRYRRIVRSSREFISKPEYARLLEIFVRFGVAAGRERNTLVAEALTITGEMADNSKPCVGGGLTPSYMWDSRHGGGAEAAVAFLLERLRLPVRSTQE